MDRCRLTRAFLSGLLWWGLSAASVRAADQEEEVLSGTTLTGESVSTARRLEAAGKLLEQKKWSAALDDYQHLLDEAGDDLVPLDARRRRHCVRARHLCHLRLASLPALALRLYRRRVDDQAAKWLKQGIETRDAGLLRRVVDEAFCSRPAEQALERLGDLAFEHGDFDEAQRWWRLLAVPAREASQQPRNGHPEAADLLYPDPEPDRVARVRAKHLIARLFQGQGRRLTAELKAYRALHGKAAGHLAGSEGNYAAIVEKLIQENKGRSPAPEEDRWTSFAGSPARNLVLPRPLPARIGAAGWKWSARLDTGAVQAAEDTEAGELSKGAVDAGTARSLAFQPLIAGNLVLWADARYVNAHDLLTGRRVFRYDLLEDGALNKDVLATVDLKLPARANLRYTLSVADDRVYARLGAQGPGVKEDKANQANPEDRTNSYLICLDLKADAKRRERWRVPAKVLDKDALVFEGAPLVHSGRVTIVVSRVENNQTRNWIACYDADTGRPLWRQEICTTRTGKESGTDGRRSRHHLLTLAGTNLVYCSHAGAIVALDAVSGKRAWAVRYLSRGPLTSEGDPSPRDLAPCLAAGGRVFAAPLDSDRLLCLDADTGRTVWERDRLEVVHLLGVDQGRLVFTTPGGIRAVPVASGSDRDGWAQPAEGKLPSFGRGFLAGGWVYWPTAAEELFLRRLNVQDGSQDDSFDPTRFHRIERGNLVFNNGCLAVAGTDTLYLYVPEERYLAERRMAAARKGAAPLAFYRLALAEAGANLLTPALEHFGRAEDALASEHYQGVPIRDLARQGRHRLLLRLAALRQEEGRWQEAAGLLDRASAAEFPVPARLAALDRLGRMWALARQPARALETWQRILSTPALRRGHLLGDRLSATGSRPKAESRLVDSRQPIAGGVLASVQIGELIRRHGREVYAPIEKKAQALLATARGEHQAAVLDLLAREYPNAVVTGPALLRLGQLCEQAKRPAHAARAYRMLLNHGPAPPLPADDLALARAGLARAYEQQHCREAARAAWQELAARDGDRVVAALDPQHKVRVVVAQRLQHLVGRSPNRAPPPDLHLPLVRAWPRPQAFVVKEASPQGPLLIPENRPLSPAGKDIVLQVGPARRAGGAPRSRSARGTSPEPIERWRLQCREAGTGKRRWEHLLGDLPSWAAFQGDMVLVAGAAGVRGLSLADGKQLWEFSTAALPLVSQVRVAAFGLSAFRHTRSRLFCLQGECRLFALDANSGRLLWSHWAPGAQVRPLYPAGRFNPLYHAGEEWVVVQTGPGTRLVLDSRVGRIVHERAAAAKPWIRPPLALEDGRLVLVPDAHRVVLFDPATGKEVWTYRTSPRGDSTVSGEAPRVFGSSQALLVLVARNYGYQLERLDPHRGVPLWKVRARIVREAFEPGQLGLGASAVYYVSRNVLWARTLKDGKLWWSRPLSGPPGSWRAVCCRGSVMVYPLQIKLKPRWSWVPVGGTLLALPLRIQGASGIPVLFCDPRDGQLIERLNFPAGPRSAVQTLPHRLVVEVAGQAWGLQDAEVNDGGEGRAADAD